MQREKAFLIKAAYWAAVLAVVWLVLRYALVWLLPFLLALGFAALMEPVIALARRKLHLKRGFLAAVFTLALLALVITLGAVLVGQVIRQITDLMERQVAVEGTLEKANLVDGYVVIKEAKSA